ncbi:unnamed protein product [Dicrocoelium dendriticum]|nr:unnamed protein product [Dicrocoelium dendriticum]
MLPIAASIRLLNKQRIQYNPGDCVALLCQNSDIDVEWLLARIDPDPLPHVNSPFVLECTTKRLASSCLPVGQPVTLRLLLTHLFELNVPVTRRITQTLAECCHPSSEFAKRQATRLLQLSSREGTDLFERCIRQANVGLLDLLNSFPACRVTLARLFELLPRLRPRLYSLVGLDSDQDENGEQILRLLFTRIDVSYADGCTPMGLRRYTHRTHGVCTGWLERMWLGRVTFPPFMNLYLRQNLTGFRAPDDVRRPVIMIASGTGLAPFVGLLRRRKQLRQNSADPGNLWLIFGCRSPMTSFLMTAEFNDFMAEGLLHRCCLCFSRYHVDVTQPQLPKSFPKHLRLGSCVHRSTTARYVQHCIIPLQDDTVSESVDTLTEDQIELAEWIINRNAVIMVCGEAREMAPAVRSAWITLLTKYLSRYSTPLSASRTDFVSGDEYFKRMCEEKRYLEDIWT